MTLGLILGLIGIFALIFVGSVIATILGGYGHHMWMRKQYGVATESRWSYFKGNVLFLVTNGRKGGESQR